jgi:DNA-binding response OmpR family regulator
MKILMVGAKAFKGEYLEKLTQHFDLTFKTVKQGKDVLRLDRAKGFDLILLDLFLPDMKGYDLIPKIKTTWPESKIIAITDSNSRELESRVRKEGVIYYMIKPIDIKYLESIIKHIAGKLKQGQAGEKEGPGGVPA